MILWGHLLGGFNQTGKPEWLPWGSDNQRQVAVGQRGVEEKSFLGPCTPSPSALSHHHALLTPLLNHSCTWASSQRESSSKVQRKARSSSGSLLTTPCSPTPHPCVSTIKPLTSYCKRQVAKSLESVVHSIQRQIQCQGYYPGFPRERESIGGVCVCVCVYVCVCNVYKKVRKSEEDRHFFFKFYGIR